MKKTKSLATCILRENKYWHIVIDPSSLFFYKFIIIGHPVTACFICVCYLGNFSYTMDLISSL